MGLIKAALGAVGGTLADTWKEYFYCDAIPADTLVVMGKKQTGSRSSNTKGNDNIISNGSGIAVADGQCMIIVDDGKVVEICAEPGKFTYDASSEPSIFSGKLGDSIKQTFATIGKRFAYGGDTGHDQRVYYFNTKEILDNKFGTANPIPFRVVDRNIGLDIDLSVRCNGMFSYRIADPILFYTNVCGNISGAYTKDNISDQLRTEFVGSLQTAFGKLSEKEIRPSALPAHSEELSDLMNESLTKKWGNIRGLAVVSVALNPITLTEEDQMLLKTAQRNAINRDPAMAAATTVGAQAAAMESAAKNPNGAMMGFMGMNMAQQAGGVNASSLFQMAANQQAQAAQAAQQAAPAQTSAPAGGWTCSCGQVNSGKFCSNCGSKKPETPAQSFCTNCGWKVTDPSNPPKFCPECGNPFAR
ncbi:MAG: SPFH domain-containing protein [Lachnospiraceae bacterium]|jgi:membrane protease subunit (stomatin/prohibitin family)